MKYRYFHELLGVYPRYHIGDEFNPIRGHYSNACHAGPGDNEKYTISGVVCYSRTTLGSLLIYRHRNMCTKCVGHAVLGN